MTKPDQPDTSSYLVSRPLANPALGQVASHNYVVSHARYPGDPQAKVFSYGHGGKSGKLEQVGLVTGSPKVGAGSRNTYVDDSKHWRSMKANPQPSNVSKIDAPCGVVESHARAFKPDKNYRMTPVSRGSANSNTAAQAVANRSAGKHVPTPGTGRLSPGAAGSDKIRFRNQQNLDKLRQRGGSKPPSREQQIASLRARANRTAASVKSTNKPTASKPKGRGGKS